jgi:monoamine oxidase
VDEFDVVVVGAGLAGLTAARDLEASGRSIVVLEARDRVGGRLLNHTFADGTVVELGGQWIGPTQHRVRALADELGLALFASYDDGESILELNGRQLRFADATFGLTGDVLQDVGTVQAATEELAETVVLDAPWATPDAEALDGQTADAWLVERCATPEGLGFWRTLITAIISAEACETSLLHWLFYVKSGGLIDMLVSTAGGAQESRVRGGSQALATGLAARLADVRVACPVTAIEQDDAGVRVVHEGGELRGERVIVALPPTLSGRIRYAPALPAHRDHLIQNCPAGWVIKIQMAFDEPFWRSDGLTGMVVSLDRDVSVMFDNSPEDLRCGVLLGFLEANAGRRAALLSAKARKASVLADFASVFGPRAAAPREYVEHDWAADEWSRGCYGGRLTPNAWTQYGTAMREAVGRIHFAGAETADVWNGYMDGAVRSGERAAAEVAIALQSPASAR